MSDDLVVKGCYIEATVARMPDAFGNLTTHSPARTVANCRSHGWAFPVGHPIGTGTMCPIGQIEEATEKALARIAAATREAGVDVDLRYEPVAPERHLEPPSSS